MDARLMEVSLACSDCEEMSAYFERILGGVVLFRGLMAGEPFVRLAVAGGTLVFRQQPDWPGSQRDDKFRNHIGFRVPDLAAAVAEVQARGGHFVLAPEQVRSLQRQRFDSGEPYLKTTYVAPPLTLDSISGSGYRHDVAIFEGPDHLAIELNEVHEADGLCWFGDFPWAR